MFVCASRKVYKTTFPHWKDQRSRHLVELNRTPCSRERRLPATNRKIHYVSYIGTIHACIQVEQPKPKPDIPCITSSWRDLGLACRCILPATLQVLVCPSPQLLIRNQMKEEYCKDVHMLRISRTDSKSEHCGFVALQPI